MKLNSGVFKSFTRARCYFDKELTSEVLEKMYNTPSSHLEPEVDAPPMYPRDSKIWTYSHWWSLFSDHFRRYDGVYVLVEPDPYWQGKPEYQKGKGKSGKGKSDNQTGKSDNKTGKSGNWKGKSGNDTQDKSGNWKGHHHGKGKHHHHYHGDDKGKLGSAGSDLAGP